MYVQIILGVLAGIVTGLLPGIHVNTVVALLLAREIADPSGGSVFILSLAITHSITEFIPTAFLGVPDATTVEAQLPAHELATSGRAYEALSLSVLGSAAGGLLCILIASLSGLILAGLSAIFVREAVVVALCLFVLVPPLRSKSFAAFLTVGMASGLGFVSLGAELLMPLLAGLFGIPYLIEALRSEAAAPPPSPIRISVPERVPVLAAVPIGFLFSFLPGAGASTASCFVSRFAPRIASTSEDIIALNSALSTVNYATSVYTLIALDRARNGAVVGIRDLGSPLALESMLVIIGIVCVIAAVVALVLGALVARLVGFVSVKGYRIITLIVLGLNVLAVIVLTGLFGVIFCAICTAVGLYALRKNVPKVCLLSCLTAPTIYLIA